MTIQTNEKVKCISYEWKKKLYDVSGHYVAKILNVVFKDGGRPLVVEYYSTTILFIEDYLCPY